MNQINGIVKKLVVQLFSTRAAALYFVLFAGSIGLATFIENDFGTSAAQHVIFKAWWFELLLLLFGITVLVNIVRYRMIQQKKWALLLFHAAILIILLGAAITRYWGEEGIMHIREGDLSSKFLSAETFLKFNVLYENETYEFDEQVLFSSLGDNTWDGQYLIKDQLLEVELTEFIPNPIRRLAVDPDGEPILKLVVAGSRGREEYFLKQGEARRIAGQIFNFKEMPQAGAINIKLDQDSLLMQTSKVFTRTVMATQVRDTLMPGAGYEPLLLRALHSDGNLSFVFPEFHRTARIEVVSQDPKVKNESTTALLLSARLNGNRQETYVYGNKGLPGQPSSLRFGDFDLSISYGAREVKVPFAIRLNKFIMERYPGTNSASSYASEVTVIDPDNPVPMDYRIYMNNILNYGGYRFFQSSFDRDEKGTYLSVNSDFWGTLVSYLGYALLTIGMLLTFFSRRTRFAELIGKIRKLRAKSGTFVLVLLLGGSIYAQERHLLQSVSLEHADLFSTLVVQDFKGRMKPVHTLSREVMRKVSRKESWDGLSADQFMLSAFINSQDWYAVPMIKLGKHKGIAERLGVNGDYAAYRDFFEQGGAYKLRDEVRRVYNMDQKDRDVYAKELLKVDERLNIMSMVFSGSLLKIVPNPRDPSNTWLAYSNHQHQGSSDHDHGRADAFFNAYGAELRKGIQSGNYDHAGHLLEELRAYQLRSAGDIIPSESKIRAEITLNKLNVFTRLGRMYMLIGLALLFFLFVHVFKPNWKLKRVYYILFSLVLIGFALHTVGLGLRWYVSGRAPWSNGYESMIYIAWTSTLAGILFTRRSFGGLAATMVLASTILMVSTLSFLDPEITPLVPVLRSYWLTIHVSLVAGSYGFLMLGAIIGLMNLILMTLLSPSNIKRSKRIIQEMTYISELTLIGGLFMLSIGTYLGGVWANESWGRYWGWDAKETWALVTILVYAFILHMRLVPKLRGLFAYNLATIFGLASVIMTYYGVNYYLSGLHSYATGDPVPIPNWVYVVLITIGVISLIAFVRKRRFAEIT